MIDVTSTHHAAWFDETKRLRVGHDDNGGIRGSSQSSREWRPLPRGSSRRDPVAIVKFWVSSSLMVSILVRDRRQGASNRSASSVPASQLREAFRVNRPVHGIRQILSRRPTMMLSVSVKKGLGCRGPVASNVNSTGTAVAEVLDLGLVHAAGGGTRRMSPGFEDQPAAPSEVDHRPRSSPQWTSSHRALGEAQRRPDRVIVICARLPDRPPSARMTPIDRQRHPPQRPATTSCKNRSCHVAISLVNTSVCRQQPGETESSAPCLPPVSTIACSASACPRPPAPRHELGTDWITIMSKIFKSQQLANRLLAWLRENRNVRPPRRVDRP